MFDQMFVESGDRIQELKVFTITSLISLHEAGHVLIARHRGLTVKRVSLPSIDSILDPEGTTYPGVQLESQETRNDPDLVEFFLAGLFGETSPYDDEYIKRHFCELRLGTTGAKGDLIGAANCSQGSAVSTQIAHALKNSRYGADRSEMLRRFPFHETDQYARFRALRGQHRDLASELYSQWKTRGFGAFEFG